MPIFSTLLGVVALGEPLTWYEPVGAAVVIWGAVIAQSRDRPAPGVTGLNRTGAREEAVSGSR